MSDDRPPDDQNSVARKIAALREALGDSQAAFARRINAAPMSVSRWEDGYPVSRRFQSAIAALAQMSVGEFFYTAEGPRIVPNLGIASEEWVSTSARAPNTPPPCIPIHIGGFNQVSITIEGRGLMHAGYRDGDIVIGEKIIGPGLDEAVGRDCIVKTRSGALYLKVLQRSSRPKLYTLRSYSPDVPDVEDVELEWAAPVRWIGRA